MALEYPIGLPCPQTSTVQAKERRAMTPGDPVTYRAMQRNLVQTETLVFVFPTFAKAQQFMTWGEDELHQWGAWFSAHWPLPQGGNAVRKFITPPSWPDFYAAIGWRVTAQCEVRGEGLGDVVDSGAGTGDTTLWLDEFNGAPIILMDHAQDIPLNDSVWFSQDGVLFLTGAGSAAHEPGENAPGGGQTLYGFDGGAHLKTGWRLETSFTLVAPPSSSSEGGDPFVLFLTMRTASFDPGEASFMIRHSAEDDIAHFVLQDGSGNSSEYTIASPRGAHTIVLQNIVDTTHYTLKVNGSQVMTFDEYTPWNYSVLRFSVFMGADSNASIERGAIVGAIGTPIDPPLPPEVTTVGWFSPITDGDADNPDRDNEETARPFDAADTYFGGVKFIDGGPVGDPEFSVAYWEPQTFGLPGPSIAQDGNRFELSPPMVGDALTLGFALVVALVDGSELPGFCVIIFYESGGGQLVDTYWQE